MQNGHVVKISNRWYVRYWERRNVNGSVEQKRVSYCLGSVTTRGKRPPADIEDAAAGHMATVNGGKLPAERITTIGEFLENVYLPWIDEHKRPSTARGYRDIWQDHLKPLCADVWMKNVRTFHVQGWLNSIGEKGLSRNTLKHVKSVISAIFKLAKQLEDVTFGLKKDQVSDVIRTKQGFVILKVTEHQAAGIPQFSEIENRLQEAVYMQKLQPALRDYLKKLREEAFIDIKPGYVDTGASANQSKPVVTTAAKESSARELKKKKKIGLF